MSSHSQYVDTDRAVLGWHVPGADGVLVRGLRRLVCPSTLFRDVSSGNLKML